LNSDMGASSRWVSKNKFPPIPGREDLIQLAIS